MQNVSILMRRTKETPGTWVYTEDLPDGGGAPPMVKTLYVQRWVFGTTPPETITVTVERGNTVNKGTNQ